MATKKNHAQNSVPARDTFQVAFEATAKARAALLPANVMLVNLDVQLAIATVLGTLPALQSLRAQIVVANPNHDMDQFDALQSYAQALAYAQTVYLGAAEPSDELPALAARAAELRDILLADITALGKRLLIDIGRLSELKGGTGYLAAGSDLGVLANLLREHWDTIESKTAIELAELDEASQLFERITMAHAGRMQPTRKSAAADDDRRRAFTLMLKAYDQAQRAVTYLRWDEDDVARIVPSLWKGRGGRPNTKTEETVVDSAAPASNPNDPVPPAEPGMPGGSPFL